MVCALLMVGLSVTPPALAVGVVSAQPAAVGSTSKPINGSKWLVIGDSNSTLNIAQVQGRSYTVYAPAMTRGKLFKEYSTATSGNRADQQYTKLTRLLTAGARPTMASVMVGTNELSQGVPLATWQKNYQKIVNKLIQFGIEPVIVTLPPRSGPVRPTSPAIVDGTWNAWLRTYAQQKGLLLVDAWKAVADPRTREFKKGHFNAADGVHVNGQGQMMIAQEFVRVLTPHLTTYSIVSKQALLPLRTDSKNLVPNGVLRSASTMGWYKHGRVKAHADSTAPGGYTLDLNATARDRLTMLSVKKLPATGRFRAGDRMKIALKSKIVSSSNNWSGSGMRLIVRQWKGSKYVDAPTEYYGQNLVNTTWLDHAWEWTVAPGTTAITLYWKFEPGPSSKRQIHAHLGGVGLYNLTALRRV